MIFDDTVENNVRMGKQDAASFEIHEACRRANVHDFILSLVHSYKTRIGAGGIKLTIGQQQRIAIARVCLKGYWFIRHLIVLYLTEISMLL